MAGGGSDPTFQLLGYYSKLVADRAHTPAVRETCYPALGVVVVGDLLRCVARLSSHMCGGHLCTPARCT